MGLLVDKSTSLLMFLKAQFTLRMNLLSGKIKLLQILFKGGASTYLGFLQVKRI